MVMKLDRTMSSNINVYDNKGNFLNSYNDSFDNLKEIRAFVYCRYRNSGIIQINVSQQSEYYRTIKINTNL